MAEIDGYTFGRVTIDGHEETHDVIVLPERVVRGWWRKEGHGTGTGTGSCSRISTG